VIGTFGWRCSAADAILEVLAALKVYDWTPTNGSTRSDVAGQLRQAMPKCGAHGSKTSIVHPSEEIGSTNVWQRSQAVLASACPKPCPCRLGGRVLLVWSGTSGVSGGTNDYLQYPARASACRTRVARVGTCWQKGGRMRRNITRVWREPSSVCKVCVDTAPRVDAAVTSIVHASCNQSGYREGAVGSSWESGSYF
jgi:hypothetical protein